MKRWHKWGRRSTWRRFYPVLGGSIGVYLLIEFGKAVIQGVVGNRADDWLGGAIVSLLLSPVSIPSIPLWVGLLVFIGVVYTSIDDHFSRTEARTRNERMKSVIDLNLTAETAIAKMVGEIDDLEDNISRTLQKLLEDIINAFPGQTFRGAILRPDSRNKYLEIWEHIGLDKDSLPNGCFCIGPRRGGQEEPGVAGYAWHKRMPQFVHVYKEGAVYTGDHHKFIPIGESHVKPPYKSFAAVPLMGYIGSQYRPLGVLLCDSSHSHTFDDEIEREMLINMAATISRTIVVYKHLRKLRGRLNNQSRTNGVGKQDLKTPCQQDDSMVISNSNSGKRKLLGSKQQDGNIQRLKKGVVDHEQVQRRTPRKARRPSMERHE